jgi:hypothetical protein
MVIAMHDSSPTLLHRPPNRIGMQLMRRAYNRDGLPEITTGLCLLFSAGLIYLHVLLPPGSRGFDTACLVFAFGVPALIFGAPKAIAYVRNRYLVERAGYVKARAMQFKTIAMGSLCAIAVSIVLLGLVPRLAQPQQWLLAGAGFGAGVLAAVCGRTPRFVVIGVITALTGIAVALSHVSLSIGFAILWSVTGLAILVSGCVVLARFLRMPRGD